MLRLPTIACYCLIGVGLGILAACQIVRHHGMVPAPKDLYGYGCHEEESKPIMRGLLHLIACVVCGGTLTIQTFLKGSTRHPSDFVMAYFAMQYFASAIYHRQHASPSVVSVFTLVDIGWIAITILGCALVLKLKKVRHVMYMFLCFASAAFLYESIAREGFDFLKYKNYNLPANGLRIVPGEYLLNLESFAKKVKVDKFIYSHWFENWIWTGLKILSAISFAIVPFVSPTALDFRKYNSNRRVLFFCCISCFLVAFLCFGLQTASRKGMSVSIPWHVRDVWGFHEDFHFILVIAHTFTSHLYDTVYYDINTTPGASSSFDTVWKIVKAVSDDYNNHDYHFQLLPSDLREYIVKEAEKVKAEVSHVTESAKKSAARAASVARTFVQERTRGGSHSPAAAKRGGEERAERVDGGEDSRRQGNGGAKKTAARGRGNERDASVDKKGRSRSKSKGKRG